MAFLENDGLKLYYETHGQGTPLVLINGFGSDHTGWLPVLDGLSQSFQVILLDNRGVGQTQDDGLALTCEGMAEDVIALLDHLHIRQAHFVGISMGGAIVQSIAIHYPERVLKIGLLATCAHWSLVCRRWLETYIEMLELDINPRLIQKINAPFFRHNILSNDKHYQDYLDYCVNSPKWELTDVKRQARALLDFDSREQLQDIQADALILYAEEDLLVLPKYSLQLAKGITNSQVVMIPGAHCVVVEQFKRVEEALLQFLE